MATMPPRKVLFEGVESAKFVSTRIPDEMPDLGKIGSMTVTNAIWAVLAHANRPMTVFEIAAELKKRGREVKVGQYELFSTVYQHLTGEGHETFGFKKV